MVWVANKGQIVQILLAFLGCAFASIKAWPDMQSNQLAFPIRDYSEHSRTFPANTP